MTVDKNENSNWMYEFLKNKKKISNVSDFKADIRIKFFFHHKFKTDYLLLPFAVMENNSGCLPLNKRFYIQIRFNNS
jgi:hypothetical protein